MPEAPKTGLSGQNIDIGTYTAEVHMSVEIQWLVIGIGTQDGT
jgi:hypothetical protein